MTTSMFKKSLFITVATSLLSISILPAYAISEHSVESFAQAMNRAANNQNIGQVAKLIDDGAIISLTRQGKTTTLDKNAYLQLLQQSWAGASEYQYHITVSDIVISGTQAKAQMDTVETWNKDNKEVTFSTHSRATLTDVGSNAVLLRAVSQVTVE